MKKTCDRCMALLMAQGEPPTRALGYSFKDFKPIEECPKPLTVGELVHSDRKGIIGG
jgi:hypothetical protein